MIDTTQIARIFLQFLFTIKMYHWSTTSYARHKATDFFTTEATPLIDRFIEIMSIGHGRVLAGNDTVTVKPITVVDDDTVVTLLQDLCKFLTELVLSLDEVKDGDLLSIKDDILGVARQTLYLFTLS